MTESILHGLAEVFGVGPDAEEKPKRARPSSLQKFLEEDITTDSGKWTPEGHEPYVVVLELIDRVLRENETDVEISVLGAEQSGKTVSAALGPALHMVADYGLNVIYQLPTDKFAHRFGRTRLKKIVSGSRYIREQLRDVDAVDQATLKEINGHYLYILGTESVLNSISIPADVIVGDEVDKLNEENREWAEGRVAHSTRRLFINVSAGYNPEGGISRLYNEGTQFRLFYNCQRKSGCGRRNINLEESFPDCMAQIEGKWERVCPYCQAKLDLKKFRFVASHPERAAKKRYSFRISSLSIAARPADHIMKRWEKAKKRKSALAKFRCAELALPDAGAMQRVTDADIHKMRNRGAETQSMLLLGGSARPRFAGVDSGDVCHLWVHERDEQGRMRLVWAEIIDADNAENIVCERIPQLGIVSLVWDKKPLTTVARGAAYRYPRVVALQDFKENSTLVVADEEHLKKTYRCVKVDRNDSLDEFTDEITDDVRGLILPAEEHTTAKDEAVIADVIAQLKTGARKARTITENGRTVDKYVKAVPNHFLMAGNSSRMAELIVPSFIPFLTATSGGAVKQRTRRDELLGRDPGDDDYNDDIPRGGRRHAILNM
jgi:Phage terminase large subunit (GpA)